MRTSSRSVEWHLAFRHAARRAVSYGRMQLQMKENKSSCCAWWCVKQRARSLGSMLTDTNCHWLRPQNCASCACDRYSYAHERTRYSAKLRLPVCCTTVVVLHQPRTLLHRWYGHTLKFVRLLQARQMRHLLAFVWPGNEMRHIIKLIAQITCF